MDLLAVLGLITGLMSTLILAPLSVITLIRFYKHPDTEIMKHRQKVLVYYMNTVTILGLLFQWTLISIHIWQVYFGFMLTHIIHIIDGSFIWIVFALFCIKTWLLFYDKQYHSSNASQTWKQQINSQYTSWYVVNKQKWGNFQFVFWKVIIIPLICCIVLESVFESMVLLQFNIHSMFILSIIFLVPSFFVHIIKLNGFDDIFGIKQEIFYQIMVMFVIMSIHLVQLLVQITYKFEQRTDWLITLNITSITLFLMSFISTSYPVYLHNKAFNEIQLSSLFEFQLSNSHTISSPTSTTHTNTLSDMFHVIAHKTGFDAFMMHLINEFATENLLFVLEVIQVKHEHNSENKEKNLSEVTKHGTAHTMITTLKSHMESDHTEAYLVNSNNNQIWGKVCFPVGLPRSEVLNSHKKLRDQFYALYCKYVKVSALYSINISYNEKKKIDEFFSTNYHEIVNETQMKTKDPKAVIKACQIASRDSIVQNTKALELLGMNIKHNVTKQSNTYSDIKDEMDQIAKESENKEKIQKHSNDFSESSQSKSKLKNLTIALSHSSKSKKRPNRLSTPMLNQSNTEQSDNMNLSAPEWVFSQSAPHTAVNVVHEDSYRRRSVSMIIDTNGISKDCMVILDYDMDEENENELESDMEEEDKEEFNDEHVSNHDNERDREIEKEMNVSEMLNIMDGACIEVLMLMYYSYVRFTKTKKGQRILETLIMHDT